MPTGFEAQPDLESSSDAYATRFDGAVGAWFLEVQLNATVRQLQGLGPSSIVDVGGGHGQTLDGLLREGHQVVVTGSDPVCAERLTPFLSNSHASFACCPLTDIPFEDREFDVALSYRMMTHLERWDLLVSELCRVSRKRVLVDYPTMRSFNILNEALFTLKKGVEKNTRHYHVFHEREIIASFRKNGFQLKSRIGQFTLPMAFHRAHKNRAVAKAIEGGCRMLGLSYCFGSPVIACFEREIQ